MLGAEMLGEHENSAKMHPWEPLELHFHGVTHRAVTLGSNM